MDDFILVKSDFSSCVGCAARDDASLCITLGPCRGLGIFVERAGKVEEEVEEAEEYD